LGQLPILWQNEKIDLREKDCLVHFPK